VHVLTRAAVFFDYRNVYEGERRAFFADFSAPAGNLSGVTVVHRVDADGRYDGLTLRDALPLVVAEIVAAMDPVEVIVFGSVARGEDGPDSDLDLLVVLDHADRTERRKLTRDARASIRTFVPVDVVIADVAEMAADRDDIGSAVYWPVREGVSMYRRKARRAG